MKIAIIALAVVQAIFALEVPDITGTTPPAIDCPNSLCAGKYDGNFELDYYPNYFVQCVSGLAYCQACWPLNLVFSQKCNQCLYNKYDDCITTLKWEPAVTYHCPDKCPQKGPDFSGNIADPYNPYHYLACWKGVTVGCVACPSGLQFNEEWNACLYEGRYKTEPSAEHKPKAAKKPYNYDYNYDYYNKH